MELFLIPLLLLMLKNYYYCKAEFTFHFNKFLQRNYGSKVQKSLERLDLGFNYGGSFGGKLDDNDDVKRKAVLFVHGALSSAQIFLQHRYYFIQQGYSWSELYATSYGDGFSSTIFDGVHCKYIKQIRLMLIALNNYTGKSVDIIAHSMGSAVSRKAILGGHCCDTNEFLGDALTPIVNTFISIAGANYGLEICPQIITICNNISSLNCNSKLMKELNSQGSRFEGRNSYDIYGLSDSIIGHTCCNNRCAILSNHNASFEISNLDHYSLLSQTLALQLSLLKQSDNRDRSNSITDVDDEDAEDEAYHSRYFLVTYSEIKESNNICMHITIFVLKIILFLLFSLINQTQTVFTNDFNKFLIENYGEEMQKKLERIDVGPGMIGSFGGKVKSEDKLSKRIRNFIIAVHEYTQKKVDIIAFSLGVLISRKAILGQKCLDTGEQLGHSITFMVETFIAIGGVANGLQFCKQSEKSCKDKNSMRCNSLLLEELNSQPNRYEGNNSYALFSFGDRVLGLKCCKNLCGQLRNAVFTIGFPNMDHFTLSSATKDIQLYLLEKHPTSDNLHNDIVFSEKIEIYM
ncbi:unnamed protein product [Thelazia callipaeda]|uniref:Lipase domain-containing protein n=1 Tax=Thelazia callipaeda TaxID=103827 RepID=A0A0N5CXE2_THECL|nr:unnamed protein product [Thelazia callipaeda]